VSYNEVFHASAGSGTQLSPIAELVEKEASEEQEMDYFGFDDVNSDSNSESSSSSKSVIDWKGWGVDDATNHVQFEDFDS